MHLAGTARMTKLAALALVFASACATESTQQPEGSPKQHMPAADQPTFTLFVSNQSLDRSLVDIQVYIDGELAVSGDFNVFSGHDGEGCGGAPLPQHNWYEFDFALPAGAHQITVASEDVAATLDASVGIDARKYGVLDYWYDATTDEPEHFGFFDSVEPPAFQ